MKDFFSIAQGNTLFESRPGGAPCNVLAILDYLHPIVVYTVRECAAGRAAVLHPWQLKVNMDFLRKIFKICDNDLFQFEQLCSIILLSIKILPFRDWWYFYDKGFYLYAQPFI